VEEGLISRFGSIDPSEGGNTARHQVFVAYKFRPSEDSEITALGYVGTYRFNLFSNFTLYLNDPEMATRLSRSIAAHSTEATSVIASCTETAAGASTPRWAAWCE